MACWKWTSTGTWSHRLLKTGLFPKNGLTYTYKLQRGQMDDFWIWEVKAQDFATGLKHAADKPQAIYLVQKSVVLDDYVSGKTSGISQLLE